MNYREYAPTAALQAFVRCYWTLTSSRDDPVAEPEAAFPDGSPELIFNLAEPFFSVDANGARTVQPLAMLVGQITRPIIVGASGVVDLAAVRFTPNGGALVCRNMAAITDSWLDASTLPGVALGAIIEQMPGARGSESLMTQFEPTLMAMVAGGFGPDRQVSDAVRAIEASHGMVALDELALSLGCSLRHLQRRFALQVGISPKLLARIRRFQRVFHAWKDDPRSLSRVAVECGYFDQSHLIRDFRDFAGRAPAEFLANQPEFTQFFLPLSR